MAGENKTLPSWIRSRVSLDQAETVERAVGEAEKKTSGEIVPMVVRNSSTYGHVYPLLFFAIWGLLQIVDLGVQKTVWDQQVEVWWFALIELGLAAVFAGVLGTLPWVRRKLIPRADRSFQVDERAELEFYRLGIQNTAGATGILIFVSLLEHRVVVLADKSINEKMPEGTWEDLVDALSDSIRSGKMAEGLTAAVHRCADILAEHFPRSENDQNELRNHLVIKD